MKLVNFSEWCRLNESIQSEGKICTEEETTKAKEVTDKANTILVKAVSFWKGWISDPITRKKFKASYKFDDTKTDEIFKNYFNAFDKIKLLPYGRCSDGNQGGYFYRIFKYPKFSPSKTAVAFVLRDTEYLNQYPEDKFNIYINIPNLSGKSDDYIEGTLVHEVQHILYLIHPLNPEIKLQNCFTIEDAEKPTGLKALISNLFKGFKKPAVPDGFGGGNEEAGLKELMKTFKLDKTTAEKVMAFIQDSIFDSGLVNYATDDNEFMSRVIGLRHRFGIKPGEDIKPENLKPALVAVANQEWIEKNMQDEIILILIHWAVKGYMPIKTLLNKINALAAKDSYDSPIKTV
jgi:hypothetical protein